jgi:hypothetical protein
MSFRNLTKSSLLAGALLLVGSYAKASTISQVEIFTSTGVTGMYFVDEVGNVTCSPCISGLTTSLNHAHGTLTIAGSIGTTFDFQSVSFVGGVDAATAPPPGLQNDTTSVKALAPNVSITTRFTDTGFCSSVPSTPLNTTCFGSDFRVSASNNTLLEDETATFNARVSGSNVIPADQPINTSPITFTGAGATNPPLILTNPAGPGGGSLTGETTLSFVTAGIGTGSLLISTPPGSTAVPEPATFGLIGLALTAVGLGLRRRRNA